MNDIEITIIKALLFDSKYFGIVYPFLEESVFSDIKLREIFKYIKKYFLVYNKHPYFRDFVLFFKNESENIPEKFRKELIETIKQIKDTDLPENEDVLYRETEKYIKKQRLTEAILKSAELIEKNKEFDKILGIIEEPLKIDFDMDIGHIYNENIKERFDYYHTKLLGIPLGITSIDKDLANGIIKKTLNIIVSPSHGGKTAFMINSTANFILRQKNVIYYTLEMSDLEISKRIDANLLGIPINKLKEIDYNTYEEKIKSLGNIGKLLIKEYPAGFLTTTRIKSHLQKLRAKEFIPDIIVIDYLGLMASSRISLHNAGSYQYYKSIAEEVHALSKELNIPILTAFQLNRSAYNNIDSGMENISDSIGIVQTADTIIALLSDEKLRNEGLVLAKFLKNRIGGKLSQHLLKFEPQFMRFYDAEDDSEQNNEIQVPSITDCSIDDLIFG